MSYWNNYWHKFTYIGRFGDHLHIRDLPIELRGIDVTDHFGTKKDSKIGNVVVCGSPGEVANNKNEGFLFDAKLGNGKEFTTTGNMHRTFIRNSIWIMIALGSPDQLRQRVSWALSQVSSNILSCLHHRN